MSEAEQLSTYVIKSYRYLRLSIIVVLFALIVAVLIERDHLSCWQGSISSYYYTPVHSLFVGALLTLAVSLLAIRGATDWEDALLNVAGVLAAIVAFVPTSPSSPSCSSTTNVLGGDTLPYINNNLLAFTIAGVATMIAVAIGMLIQRDKAAGRSWPTRVSNPAKNPSFAGLLLGFVLLVAGLIWYFCFRDNFLDHAHGGSAVVMFIIIGVVIFMNALSSPVPTYRWVYGGVTSWMALSAIGVLIADHVDSSWRHEILVLEILEIAALVAFWSMQTIEHWKVGVPTGPERATRAAASSLRNVGRRRHRVPTAPDSSHTPPSSPGHSEGIT